MKVDSRVVRIPRRSAERVDLTSTRIKALTPRSKPYRINDAKLAGLVVTVSVAGTKVFVVRGRIGKGASVDITLGKCDSVSLADARATAREYLADMHKGKDPRLHRTDGTLVVRQVVDRFVVRQHDREIVSADRMEQNLERALKGLMTSPITKVGRADLVKRIERIERNHGPAAADAARAVLGSMLNYAADQGDVEYNVLAGYRRQKDSVRVQAAKKQAWTLQPDRIGAFWKATESAKDPIFTALLRFAFLTGARRGEVAQASWDQIHGDTWTIPAAKRKTGREHVAILGKSALPVQGESPLIFPGRGGKVISGWSKRLIPVSHAMSEPVSMHGLRRGYKTVLSHLRVRSECSELMLGHARRGLEGVYNQADLMEERREAQQLFDTFVRGQIDGA